MKTAKRKGQAANREAAETAYATAYAEAVAAGITPKETPEEIGWWFAETDAEVVAMIENATREIRDAMKTTARTAERLKNAMHSFEEAYKQATEAGVDVSMPPGSGAFNCAGKSAEEQATAIEEATRELEEATEKAIFDKARNAEEEAEVAKYQERGRRKSQGQHDAKIEAQRREINALRLKLSEAERERDAARRYIIDQQGK